MSKNNRNLVPQIVVRLTQEQYNWFMSYCELTELPKNAIMKSALDYYRKSLETNKDV